MNCIDTILTRQELINNNEQIILDLPKNNIYSVSNLRGGVGKTTLCYNLGYLSEDVLIVDTCPQGNLTELFGFMDEDMRLNEENGKNVLAMILPHIVTGLDKINHVAMKVGKNYFIPSTEELYLFPSQFYTAITQTYSLDKKKKEEALKNIVFSLWAEIQRELLENNIHKCLIDTSPFMAGATKLSWYAADALIIPIRPDQQSINSLELMIKMLINLQKEMKNYLPKSGLKTPKIQMVVITHYDCNDKLNQSIINKIYDILSKNRELLSTDVPEDHIMSVERLPNLKNTTKPVELLEVNGKTKLIIDRIKNQLRFIHNQLW